MIGIGVEGSDEQPCDIKINDKSISVAWIWERADKNEFQLTGYAHKGRQEEAIKVKDIRDTLMLGKILEDCPDDLRGVSCLVFRVFRGQSDSSCLWSDEVRVASGYHSLYIRTPNRWMRERGQSEVIKVPHNYGDCCFCGMEVVEKIAEPEYRWKGRLCHIEGVPASACRQCGEKHFTAQVSEAIDGSVEAKEIKRTTSVPVKGYMSVEVI